jgi:DNA polymerase
MPDLVAIHPTLDGLKTAARTCTACPLYARATQTVFGMGSPHARVVLVGEQPGHEEDLAGAPFVGPAGRVLDEALRAAGIDRQTTYVTNAVKHFKWEPRGTRRIHAKPSAGEISACRPWLEAELALIQPAVVVCLGATAARAVLGPRFRLTEQRGRPVASALARQAVATVHPSAVLRMPDSTERRRAMAALIQDLEVVARLI